jgi:L-seryl-tRNA(Ser) seleniumtransferase
MKLDPHLPQLPSIGELLEHPRVKGVVSRINRSTLAHRATGFLEELRASLAERTGRVEIPTVTQLAERLARRLLGEPPADGPVINATGVVVGDPELTPPLADAAVQAMMQVASEYHSRTGQIMRSAQSAFCQLTGAESALLVSCFDAAVNIVLASIGANREVLVANGASPPLGGLEWRKLAARHAAIMRTSQGEAAALAAAGEDGASLAALIRSPEAEGSATTADVGSIAKKLGASFVDVAPLAGVLNPQTYGLQSTETIRERLEHGVDLVIADGAGLLGGPACGVIVGKQSLVQAASAHYLASMSVLDAASAAALHATLMAYRDDEDGSAAFSIPVWQLLSAPYANLKQRAERLSALIAAASNAASTEILEIERPWRRTGQASFLARTCVISVQPRTGDVRQLVAQLRQRAYPIAATATEDAVHLDLRSVFPRWDQQLVAAFEGTVPSKSAAEIRA